MLVLTHPVYKREGKGKDTLHFYAYCGCSGAFLCHWQNERTTMFAMVNARAHGFWPVARKPHATRVCRLMVSTPGIHM